MFTSQIQSKYYGIYNPKCESSLHTIDTHCGDFFYTIIFTTNVRIIDAVD